VIASAPRADTGTAAANISTAAILAYRRIETENTPSVAMGPSLRAADCEASVGRALVI
jgi:hypothetical protein